MATKASGMFWNIIYAVLIIFVIAVLLQLLGVFALSIAVANVIYILAIVFLVLALIHWAGLL
ncbi:MAG TPA: DUF1328 domain-containing protein [Candidatus Aquicultor sp.]